MKRLLIVLAAAALGFGIAGSVPQQDPGKDDKSKESSKQDRRGDDKGSTQRSGTDRSATQRSDNRGGSSVQRGAPQQGGSRSQDVQRGAPRQDSRAQGNRQEIQRGAPSRNDNSGRNQDIQRGNDNYSRSNGRSDVQRGAPSQDGYSRTQGNRQEIQRGAPSQDGYSRTQGNRQEIQRGAPSQDGNSRSQGNRQDIQRGAPQDQGNGSRVNNSNRDNIQRGAPSRQGDDYLRNRGGRSDVKGAPQQGNDSSARNQGIQRGAPTARGDEKGVPQRGAPPRQGDDNGIPTKGDNGNRGGSQGEPPRAIGPPGRTNKGDDYLRGGLGRQDSSVKGTGRLYDSRTGGIRPTNTNHNVSDTKALGIPGRIGGKNNVRDSGTLGAPRPLGIPVRDGNGRGNNIHGRGSLGFQVGRQEDYRTGLRWGYCHGNNWFDWFFGYSFYCYEPVYNSWFSPYYGYYCVPGYLSYVRCRVGIFTIIIPIGNTVSWNYCGRGGYGQGYNSGYNSGYGYDNSNYSGLDRALSSLSDAFRYSDVKQLDRLLPSGGNVEVFIDGDYSYTLSSDDYYDITSDLILGVNTTNFEVVQVKRLRDGGHIAVARHEYRDAWNELQTNWLTFTLQDERGGYVITQAGTNRIRPNY